jgi:hypothetical protein
MDVLTDPQKYDHFHCKAICVISLHRLFALKPGVTQLPVRRCFQIPDLRAGSLFMLEQIIRVWNLAKDEETKVCVKTLERQTSRNLFIK